MSYCTNADLIMDNGRSIDEYLDPSLSDAQKTTTKDNARTQAYNEINEKYLRNKTLVPATHINGLDAIEKDLAISIMMGASFSGQVSNVSDWVKEYRDRAMEALKNLRWTASNTDPTANSENTGDGTITIHQLFEEFVRTENWIIRALSDTDFSVYGTLTGYLPNAELDVRWPEKDWDPQSTDYGLTISVGKNWVEYPFHMTISAGSVDFAQDDIFYFTTYSSNPLRQRSRRIRMA